MPLAAHLFVFYFGIMADITPPVCLAAFTGAGIAGASPSKTGFTATRIAIASFMLPYCFVYNPMLLLQRVVYWELAILVISAFLGVMMLAGALEGWLFRDLRVAERAVIGAAAVAAIHHDITASVCSIVVLLTAAVYFYKTKSLAAKTRLENKL